MGPATYCDYFYTVPKNYVWQKAAKYDQKVGFWDHFWLIYYMVERIILFISKPLNLLYSDNESSQLMWPLLSGSEVVTLNGVRCLWVQIP